MKITKTHDFDASIDECWSMFHDPDSHVAKFTAMGHRDLRVVSSESTENQLVIEIERVVDVDVPGFARKVLKPSNLMTSVDEWNRDDDGTCHGSFRLHSKGVPIETTGMTRLTPNDDGTTHYVVDIELKVKVPLIGGKIENFTKGIVNDQLDTEFELGDRWLAEH